MNTKKTTLTQLIERLEHLNNNYVDVGLLTSLDIAKSLLLEEKQMIIDAYLDGDNDHIIGNKRSGLTYFNETFES
jgi:hypothetical protein